MKEEMNKIDSNTVKTPWGMWFMLFGSVLVISIAGFTTVGFSGLMWGILVLVFIAVMNLL